MHIKLLSIGSLPPEWGGGTTGGVATFHRVFLTELSSNPRLYNTDIIGALALNWDRYSTNKPPSSIRLLNYPATAKEQQEWYYELLSTYQPDIVKFFHIGHRWAKWHTKFSSNIPAIGSIRSWHQITQRSGEHSKRAFSNLQEILPKISGLIFPSDYTRKEGLTLGLKYSCPTLVVPNAVNLAFLYKKPVDKLVCNGRSKPGIVFVGSLIKRKRADMVIQAAVLYNYRLQSSAMVLKDLL